jgi:copper(I)-binding protein
MTSLRSLAIILVSMILITAASAAEYMAGDLRLADPWARATAGAARTGAAYITIANQGAEPDRLMEVASPIAGRAEIHAQIVEDGIAKMRKANPLEIKAGETVALEPGGLHIMLMNLKQPLREGEHVPLTLVFERTGRVDLELEVGAVGADHAGD